MVGIEIGELKECGCGPAEECGRKWSKAGTDGIIAIRCCPFNNRKADFCEWRKVARCTILDRTPRTTHLIISMFTSVRSWTKTSAGMRSESVVMNSG